MGLAIPTDAISTGDLDKLMKELQGKIFNSESIRTLDTWFLVKYGNKKVFFNKVGSQTWICLFNRLTDADLSNT